MLYYKDSKKYLPGGIVPLRVPFPGYACIDVHVRTANRSTRYKTSGDSRCNKRKNIFCSPTEYSLKNASFRLHPVWVTHPAEPAVTIAEVLPLCPSRINGNVGHKHKSQETQHDQILSHIDAYNGEEKAHMEKGCICGMQEAPRYDERTYLKISVLQVCSLATIKL